MHPNTEQLFGTIEVLSQHDSLPFLWNTETQGEFDIWNLLASEGFVKATDPELVLTHWQNMEQWGAPTDLTDYEYASPRSERKDDDWNDAIALERKALYQQLQQRLNLCLTELEAYTLAIPGARHFEWDHPNFFVSIIVGKTSDHQWLCLAPTVPDQMGIQKRGHTVEGQTPEITNLSQGQTDSSDISQTLSILGQLKPLRMCGYHHGGYDYEYDHQIVQSIAASKNQAITQALNVAQMVIRSQTDLLVQNNPNHKNVIQFMDQSLGDRHCLSISFWDLHYAYEIGQTPSGDWVGVRFFAEFEYNP
jgi:hypothetical protein